MADTNLYLKLQEALQDFKKFLDENVETIKGPIKLIGGIIPQVNQMIDKLITIVTDLQQEIAEIDLGSPAFDAIEDVQRFVSSARAVMEAGKALVPDLEDEVADVLTAVRVVDDLPSLEAVKGDILESLEAIRIHLETIRIAPVPS